MILGALIVGAGLLASTLPQAPRRLRGWKARRANGTADHGRPVLIPCWQRGVRLHGRPWNSFAAQHWRPEMNDRIARIVVLLLAVTFAV